MNPLKSVYIVSEPSHQIFVVPCFNYVPNQQISMVDLALQKRNLPPIGSDTTWETVLHVTFSLNNKKKMSSLLCVTGRSLSKKLFQLVVC